MLDVTWIRANPDALDRALADRKNVPFTADQLIALDDSRASRQLA
jgi:seryl-tRNA synthetase